MQQQLPFLAPLHDHDQSLRKALNYGPRYTMAICNMRMHKQATTCMHQGDPTVGYKVQSKFVKLARII